MPMVLDPPLTTRRVRQHAAVVLPGVRVRRLVFWRYLLVWQRPEVAPGGFHQLPERLRRPVPSPAQPFRKPK
jgi:hypothetical protein